MAVTVSVNGVNYSYPTTGDESWGSDATNAFVALVSGTLQPNATTFVLTTGDLDFGNTYGLKPQYIISRTANPADAGVLRLANADLVEWRNNANSANLTLGVDSSDRLTYNGVPIVSSGGVVPASAGGTGQSSYAVGDTLYASGATALAKLTIGTANQALVSTGTAPSWALLVNANIDAAAAITRSKLAAGTADHVIINDGAGVLSSEATLAKSRGGSGQDNSSLTFPATGTLATLAGTEILTNKDIDGGTASNSRRITLPKDSLANLLSLTRKEATVVYATDQQKPYFDDGSTLQPIGSGSGGGSSNYISNPDAETGTSPWTTYADAPAAVPTNGTGGSPSITLTSSSSSPLMGTNSFLITKGAANRQGEGVSVDFTIDALDKAHQLSIQFDYQVASGSFQAGSDSQDSDLEVFVYDVTNAVIIPVTPYKLVSNSSTVPETYKGVFQTNSNSTSYRLILHIPTTGASAWSFKFDNVIVSRQPVVLAPSVSDWISYNTVWASNGSQPSIGNGTLTSNYRRVGDSFEITIGLLVGSTTVPGTGVYSFSIPPGYAVDTTKLVSSTDSYSPLGIATILDGADQVPAYTIYHDTTSVKIHYFASATTNYNNPYTSTSPAALAAGHKADLVFRVPVVGLSSNTITGNDADARVVAARLSRAATQSIPDTTTTAIVFDTVDFDTHGGGNTSTGEYTVQVSGFYEVTVSMEYNNTSTAGFRDTLLFVNGNLDSVIGFNASGTVGTGNSTIQVGSTLLRLTAGDVLSTRVQQTSGGALLVAPSGTFATKMAVNKVSGPALPLATDKVVASYALSGTTTSFTADVDPINYDIRIVDSHSAVTTGAAWKFTAPISGTYHVSQIAGTSVGSTLSIYRNGSVVQYIGTALTTGINGASGNIELVAGDYIDLRLDTTASLTGNGSTPGNQYATQVHINLVK